MKILADFYLYNEKNEKASYYMNTKLSKIIKDSDEFIKTTDKDINFEILVIKWSDLYELLNKEGDIPLFKLLKIQKKFKICYGGYIKFRIIYETKEQKTIFENSNNIKNNSNKFFLVYNSISKYLTKEEIINLALINKHSYKIFLDNKIFKTELSFNNRCFDEDEDQNKLVNFKKLFGGPSMGLYEIKKLGMYIGVKYIYLLLQSIETYNVEIMRLNKTDIKEHEIIFRDNWTNYYIFENTIYQIKYTKEKTKLNKINKEDEINFISINVSNFGDDFDSEYFYYYIETKEIYIVTSELKIYKYNKSKKKLKLFFDESRKLKKFKSFTSLCKIRNYWKYYKFIKNKFFLSLLRFHIFDITNKNEIISFPEIRGVESVQKIEKFYYVIDYRFIYLLEEKSFEIKYKFKKYNNDFCCNTLLRIDPLLNYMQTTINDYIINSNIDSKNKKWNKKMKLKNLFYKFNDKFLCSDYFNDKEALYIKLYGLKENNSIESIKKIRIDTRKFIKRLNFEENIKDKYKNEIINNLKLHLFFNGLGDFIINMEEYFWIYCYNDEIMKKNIINKNIEENHIFSYNKIIIKSNETIRFHNVIFYDKILIVWKQKSLKILFYELNINDINNKKLKEEKNKFNSNVKILSLEDIEVEDVEMETPIFIFHSYHKLFLINNFSEDDKIYNLYEIKIEKEKVILVNSFIIKINIDENISNDESIIFAKFILYQKYFVIFSSYALYLYKIDENNKNIYNQIKRKEHNIIGYFHVKELLEEETSFIVQDDRTKDCYFYDVSPWLSC